MYAYLRGKFTTITPTHVYIDVNGVGYLVHISLNTFSKIEPLEEGKLYTYLHVKEDILALYGFFEEEEKELFKLLLSVSGIGPNTTRIILSSMTALEVRTAIVTENDAAFKKVKGVGPKTAKRVILDLKDKIKSGAAMVDQVSSVRTDHTEKAYNALLALGFQKSKISQAINKISVDSSASVEDIIKNALKYLT